MSALHLPNKFQDYQQLLAIRDLVIGELLSNEIGLNLNKLMWWLRVQCKLNRSGVISVLVLLSKSNDVEIEDNLYYKVPHIKEIIEAPHSIVRFDRKQQN